ncbi:alpha/beta hydrolase [Streptosporangium vulgare]|uniref:Alpha/beta hydrolase n=1 Tax=Streptosporangium vulgare TaxID=46190 RepID=A0ABV5TBD7_9ACTN
MFTPNPHVLVLAGPGLVADLRLLTEVADREFAALGVGGTVSAASDLPAFRTALESPDVLVVLPGPDPEARSLFAERPDAVWLDLTKADAPLPAPAGDPGFTGGAGSSGVMGASGGAGGPGGAAFAGGAGEPGGAAFTVGAGGTGRPGGPEEPGGPGGAKVTAGTHIHGRGIWGLTWAIRHAVHRLRRPAQRIPYGDHPDQWVEVRLPYEVAGEAPAEVPPAGVPAASPSYENGGQDPTAAREAGERAPAAVREAEEHAPAATRGNGGGDQAPTVVLLHGGFWRSIWGADLMDALAIDLAERGFAAWNLEYRRPDLHGWDATTADVARGVALAAESARGPLVVIGHSAGGQLALRAAADDHRITLAVSLAGVLDLAEGDRRHMSSGAIAVALGGSAAEAPAAYRSSGPLERLPLGVPQLIVQGGGDDLDLVDFGRRYARAAQESGDQVTYLEMSGDHFDVIDPASPIWRATAGAVAEHRRPS